MADNKICIYDEVTLYNGQQGQIYFMGAIEDKDGLFYGVQLNEKKGKNNGTVKEVKYFECEKQYGIFVQPHKIKENKACSKNSSLPRISIEDRIYVKSKNEYGILLFVGIVEFDSEIHYGIELEEPLGDNDGSVNDRYYFHGMEHYCVFCKANDIIINKQNININNNIDEIKVDNDDDIYNDNISEQHTTHIHSNKTSSSKNDSTNVLLLQNEISIIKKQSIETPIDHSGDSDNEEPIPKQNNKTVQFDNINEMKKQNSNHTNSTYSGSQSPSKHVGFDENVKDNNVSFRQMEHFEDVDSEFPQIGKTIVIDGGTYQTRIGITGETEPLYVIDTATDWNAIKSQNEQPIIYGKINKWKYIQQMWLSLIEEKLKYDTTEHALIVTETYDISKKNREKLTQMIFEQIQCPAFYISPSSLFSLYSTGRTSGCVIDFAYDCTRIVPIYEGYVLQLNSNTKQIGGQHVSSQLAQLLEKNSKVSQIKSFNMKILEDIKRKHCICVSNNNKINVKNISYKLPDGKVITITSKEAIQSTETLFTKTELINNIFTSIMKCDNEAYSEMFNNVIICGGTSLLKGINHKINIELNEIMKNDKQSMNQILHIANPINRQLSSWQGASIFSSLDSFTRALVTIQEYQECGPRIVDHKCF